MKYLILLPAAAIIYAAIWLWARRELQHRDKAGHRCTCREKPDQYCFYCGY